MKKYEVHPHVGVGTVKFGMTRQALLSAMGPPDVELPPGRFFGDRTLLFDAKQLAVILGPDENVCAIESRGCSFILDGSDMRAQSWHELRQFLLRRDPEVKQDRDVLESRHLGLAANTVDDEVPQGIIAFQPGYLDRKRAS